MGAEGPKELGGGLTIEAWVQGLDDDEEAVVGDAGEAGAAIALEKAGIIKPGAPLVVGPQSDAARQVILSQADRLGVAVHTFGQDFHARQEHGRMVYEDQDGLLDLPLPRLAGAHQIENAGVAIAALRHARLRPGAPRWGGDKAVEQGLRSVEWPGRLQRLTAGPLLDCAPENAEVWLDGGHNPHGARAVAQAIADLEEHGERPLYLICAMLANKDAVGGTLQQRRGQAEKRRRPIDAHAIGAAGHAARA